MGEVLVERADVRDRQPDCVAQGVVQAGRCASDLVLSHAKTVRLEVHAVEASKRADHRGVAVLADVFDDLAYATAQVLVEDRVDSSPEQAGPVRLRHLAPAQDSERPLRHSCLRRS